MNKVLLVVNAGSSSIKFKVFSYPRLQVIASGLAERLNLDGRFSIEYGAKKDAINHDFCHDHAKAVDFILDELLARKILESLKQIVGIGNRIVQGGKDYPSSCLLEEADVKRIAELAILAPLHNGPAVATIRAFQKRIVAPHIGCFDTSFHQTMPSLNYRYPVPEEWYQKHHVRRYGMHGTSHHYITLQATKLLRKEKVNIVSCHLGNGGSICAVKQNQSVATSMGLTPLPGIMMGTRSGDIDPSVIDYMAKATNASAENILHQLNHSSGLLGVSGVSSDMRDVTKAAENGNQNAQLALDLFCKRIADYIVLYINEIGITSLDAITFTGGIGENAALVRKHVFDYISLFSNPVDKIKNNVRGTTNITAPGSDFAVLVIPTNEELMISNEVIRLLKL